jgi:TetR/AcrR family transcriptional regulator, regulator of autoinduction and epiphytic fitness
MTEDVKPRPRRRYDSRRRQLQAEQTRRDIVTAAGRLFRERGYAVPMPVIAAEAGVVVETVYRIFGSKAGLIRAVVEALLAGGVARAELRVEERPAIRAVIEEPDPKRQVALYAATQPGVHRRAGGLLRAVREGAATDPELASLLTELEGRRLEGQGRFVRMLESRGALRPGLTFEAGRDVVWTLCSMAVYDMLVLDRGWSERRYETWLREALTRELLVTSPEVA